MSLFVVFNIVTDNLPYFTCADVLFLKKTSFFSFPFPMPFSESVLRCQKEYTGLIKNVAFKCDDIHLSVPQVACILSYLLNSLPCGISVT